MMKRFIHGVMRPSTLLPLVFSTALAFLIALSYIERETLSLIIRGIDVSVAIMVLMVYVPLWVQAMRSPTEEKDQYLITGIIVLFLFLGISQAWAGAFIVMDRPSWMTSHWILSFSYAMIAMSGFYFLKIPGAAREGWRYVTAALVIAVMLITISFAYFRN